MINQLKLSAHKLNHWIQNQLEQLSAWIRNQLIRFGLIHSEAGKSVTLKDPKEIKAGTAKLAQSKAVPKSKAKAKPKKAKAVKPLDYFVEARSWADDLYTGALISRNRYRLAFLVAMGLAISLSLSINLLLPMQHYQPLLINHYEDGRVTVTPTTQVNAPNNPVEIESEIVRYVVNRESYAPSSYKEQYSLTNLMSNNEVASEYIRAQSTDNKHSPINRLGNKVYRTVHIDDVSFLDSADKNKGKPKNQQTHSNLAQVNFAITDHWRNSGRSKTIPLTALVSWRYDGTPSNPADQWRNWDGFTVTRYTIEQRNVQH